MHKRILIFQIALVLTLIATSCNKDSIVDPRDEYIGKYSGLEIYTDFQQAIVDTNYTHVYIRKHSDDAVIELEIPRATQLYYYILDNHNFYIQGDGYHCPLLTIRNDSLFAEWFPSLAPRVYNYEMVKEK